MNLIRSFVAFSSGTLLLISLHRDVTFRELHCLTFPPRDQMVTKARTETLQQGRAEKQQKT